MKKIGILDTDVLIDILDELYNIDKSSFNNVVDHLLLKYDQVWIPKKVKDEFCYRHSEQSKIENFIDGKDVIRDCPIGVGENDRKLLMPEIDEGEADGIMQARKTGDYQKYQFYECVFISGDGQATIKGKDMDVETIHYWKFKDELMKKGVIRT
ncbi:MAG: hypothetical protein ACOC85_05640 [Thermoplasmatota archaeon]